MRRLQQKVLGIRWPWDSDLFQKAADLNLRMFPWEIPAADKAEEMIEVLESLLEDD